MTTHVPTGDIFGDLIQQTHVALDHAEEAGTITRAEAMDAREELALAARAGDPNTLSGKRDVSQRPIVLAPSRYLMAAAWSKGLAFLIPTAQDYLRRYWETAQASS